MEQERGAPTPRTIEIERASISELRSLSRYGALFFAASACDLDNDEEIRYLAAA
jgi:hypothetical protein